MGCRNILNKRYGAFISQMEEKAKRMDYVLSSVSELIQEVPAFTLASDEPTKRNSLFDGLATDILGRGSYLRFRAYGNSMAPFIRNGDIVLVEPKKASELRIGDIVFYRRAMGRHVAHRLIGKSGNDGSLVLTTRGDNLRHLDAPVFPEQVLGRVTRIEGRGREPRIGGRAGWALNRLLLYASSGSCTQGTLLQRVLTKFWWLVVWRKKERKSNIDITETGRQ